MKTKLSKIAHGRAGDKGNTLLLSLIPYDPLNFEKLVNYVTIERVKSHLHHQLKGEIKRFVLPELKAIQFICQLLPQGIATLRRPPILPRP